MILLDNANKGIAILEFKKHTKYDKIEDHMFGKYYPKPDGRKYNRLALLRDSINKSLPIIIIYFPTQNLHSYIIVEKIGGQFRNLYSTEIIKLDLPVHLEQKEKLIEVILQLL